MQAPDAAADVPVSVERFTKQLVITHKAVMLYPVASNIPHENAVKTVEMLSNILVEVPEMRLVVNKDGLCYADTQIFPGRSAFTAFAQDLYARGVSDVRFHAGVTEEALVTFLGMLKHAPEELARSGGFAARLWDSGVDTITVVEAVTRIADVEVAEEIEDGEEWPPSYERMRELLRDRPPAPRDRRVLIRALHDVDVLRRYLQESFHDGGSATGSGVRHAAIHDLARAADGQPGDLRSSALQTLVEAIIALPADERRELLISDMLREVRVDESIASVIRQLGVDELCRVLVDGASEDDVSLGGVARAIRNLSFIALASREEVLNASGAAMRSAGFAEDAVEKVLEMVAPSRLLVADGGGGVGETRPADSILRLLDLAPSQVMSSAEDPSIVSLQEEARAGITDGDVVTALVVLTTIDVGSEEFDQSVAALEVGLGLLVERGEYVVAADVAEALMTGVTEASERERARLVEVVCTMTGTNAMRTVYRALQMYEKGTPEHDACGRLLATLGMYAVDPLLEVLADEPEMSGRKFLVDLISSVAAGKIDELGQRISDPRWYFVRNVVSILGATREPAILPYLGRTVRHSDARVRRESIRALASVPDAMAREMIAVALDDQDAQNVQLAARYLGALRVRSAVPGLLRVAQGDGRGNREHAPRAEAIEALGVIGAREALPALETIAGKRRLIGGGRSKGLRAVAESAVAAIKATGRTEADG
ncbi:MAG: HEAT repeat domain-containing protein [Clostridiales bacterium]|nr:HEAT repeat domain-containing protein [Clostridiales bacterium]